MGGVWQSHRRRSGVGVWRCANSHPYGYHSCREVGDMGSSRVWLWRVLVLGALGLLLLSWFVPWWSINVYEIGPDAVIIRPWGLETQLRPAERALIEGAEMPPWFAPFVFTYLGGVVIVLLVSLFITNRVFQIGKIRFRLPALIVGLVGFSYIVVVVTAFVVATIRAGEYFGGINLIGYTYIDLGEPYMSGADAGFVLGYWLACAVGPLLIVLALLRNKIVGEPKSGA